MFNATVVPQGGLGFLTLWPQGIAQPLVSTLNAIDGAVTSNMAIVPTTNGEIQAASTVPPPWCWTSTPSLAPATIDLSGTWQGTWSTGSKTGSVSVSLVQTGNTYLGIDDDNKWVLCVRDCVRYSQRQSDCSDHSHWDRRADDF